MPARLRAPLVVTAGVRPLISLLRNKAECGTQSRVRQQQTEKQGRDASHDFYSDLTTVPETKIPQFPGMVAALQFPVTCAAIAWITAP